MRGGGPASRESETAQNRWLPPGAIHAILLSGGSAFGLDAAGGVMRYLEGKTASGFDTGYARECRLSARAGSVRPEHWGSAAVRPDAAMAYAACQDAARSTWRGGNVGAGAGASVGKPCGMERAMTIRHRRLCVSSLARCRWPHVVAVNAPGRRD